MEYIAKLLNFAWLQGGLMLIFLRISIFILKKIFKQNITKKDRTIELVVVIIFFGIPYLSQFIFGIKNIFYFCLVFALIGMACEFLFDLIWYRLMGSRLYRYFKGNLLGFTSWFILPYWAAAGLYFYGTWQLIEYFFPLQKINSLNIFNLTKDLAFVAVITFITIIFGYGIKDYIKGKLSKSDGFRWSKYILLVVTIWIPILYLIIYLNNLFTLIYFIFTSVTGIILEGLLSQKLKNIYGESFWLYYRYNIFHQGTSLLILPIWGAAALLAFLLFNLYLF